MFPAVSLYSVPVKNMGQGPEQIPTSLGVRSENYFCDVRKKQVVAHEVTAECEVRAGESVGPFAVEIRDQNEQCITLSPSSPFRNFSVQMTICDDAKTHLSTTSKYSETGHFWFKEYDGLSKAADYVITFALVPADTELQLPDLQIPFKVVASSEIAYILAPKPNECHRIGDPFDISLTLMDQFDNPVEDANEEFRSSISSCGMDFSVTSTVALNGEVRLEGVIAVGKIDQLSGRIMPIVMIEAEICLKSADSSEEFRVKIHLKFKAGEPETLSIVDPAEGEKYVIENGTLPQLGVLVLDAFGNAVTTAIEPKLAIQVVFGEYTPTGGRKDWPGEYALSFMTGPSGTPCPLKGGTTLKVDLEDASEKKLFARLFMHNFPDVKPTHRDFFIQKCAKPSDIRIFCSSEYDPDTTCEIRNGETMNWTAAQMIRNVSFKMMDESKNVIEKPNLTMSNFRVSWMNADWVPSSANSIKSLNAGKLPDIRAPKNDGQVAAFNVTFYEASAGPTVKSLTSKTNDTSISFQFSIKGVVGVPAFLTAFCYGSNENKIRSSETMENFVIVRVEDSCHNRVTDITSEDMENMTLTPIKGTLDATVLTKEKGVKPGDVYVKGIKVTFDEDMTSVDIEIKFMSLTTILTLDVIAGLPEKLDWVFPEGTLDKDGRLQVVNHRHAGVWSVQVKDRFGNPTKFAGLVVALGVSKRVELKPAVMKPITNSDGIASFGPVRITAKKERPPAKCVICRSLCYGLVPVQAKIDFQGLAVVAAPIKIHLKCDPFRICDFIVTSDVVDKDTFTENIVAGSEFPDFSVSLVAEDGRVVTELGILSSILMITSLKDAAANQKSFVPPNAVDEVTGKVAFEKLMVPSQTGEYTMKFLTKQPEEEEFYSRDFFYKVVGAAPRTFKPVRYPNDPWVSNTLDRTKRMVVNALKFVLQDKFGNVLPSADEVKSDSSLYDGILKLKLEADDESVKCLPQLECCNLSFPIKDGKATTEPLFLAENTVGENGMTYKVTFKAEFPDLGVEIPDFWIPFHFVDDSSKHEQLSILKSKREHLSCEKAGLLQEYSHKDRELQHLKQVFEGLRSQLQTRQTKLVSQHNELRLKIKESSRFEFETLIRETDNTLAHLTSLTNTDPNAKRVTPAAEDRDVLGRVIHLGRVQNEEDVNVVSWLMMSDMRTIVTESTAKALELLNTDKKQQVLSLEMVREVEWTEPMPHERSDPPFEPTGSPVFARHLLFFPNHEEKCRIAFGSLIADTIVIATLEDAISYREKLKERKHSCPVIATRSGEKITSAGKLVAASQVALSDPKMLRFHRVPVREMNECKSKLEGFQDLHDLADAKELALFHLQQFEDANGHRLTCLKERLAELDQLLRNIEQQEVEISRKRPSCNFDSPALKRFC